jgi:hypothetical protein
MINVRLAGNIGIFHHISPSYLGKRFPEWVKINPRFPGGLGDLGSPVG